MGVHRFLDVLLPPTHVTGDAAAHEEGWHADAPGTYCPRCGATADRSVITLTGCPICRDQRVPWAGVWRLAAYDEPVSRWIVEMKFHKVWSWAPWFGRQLAAATSAASPQLPGAGVPAAGVVVPVPLHWRRRLVRGYDQSLLMARAFAAARGLPLVRALRRTRHTRPQSDIHSHAGRLSNVRRAFTVRPLHRVDLTGWTVWLVDDVKTSGATLAAATRVLRRLGAARVNLAVIAVADPKQPRSAAIVE